MMYLNGRANRDNYQYCSDSKYIPSYGELSATGPFSTYLEWRLKLQTNQPLHPNHAWFFNPSLDIAILKEGSILLLYMHLYAKFLSVRFAKYCTQNNCNGERCLQEPDFRNIFKEYPIPMQEMLSRYKQDLIDALE